MLLLKNKSFTMIEMLMVLFIVSVVLYIMVFNVHPILNDMEKSKDINNITNSFLLLQDLSIINKEKSSMYFGEEYIECFLNDKFLFKKETNSNIKNNFKDSTLKINEDGDLYQGGTVNLEDKKIIFYLGSGSYEIS